MNSPTPREKFEDLMRTSEAFRKNVLAIGVASFRTIAREGVRRGDVSIAGKERGEAFEALCAYVLKSVEGEMVFVDDHKPEILEEARRAASAGRHIIAIILYATYFEHVLNDLVLVGCARSELEEAVATRLLRASTIFDKTGELIGDIGLPPLPELAVTGIRRVADLRNGLVHYKWVGRDEAASKAHRTRVADAVTLAESSVAELLKYEKATLLFGLEEIIGPEEA